MRKTFIASLPVFAMLLWISGLAGAEIVIGEGDLVQNYPISNPRKYYRTVSLYLASETDTQGTITRLGLDCASANAYNPCTVKIYLKNSTISSLTDYVAWDEAITGASLVFDSTINITQTGWMDFDITDFAYNSSQNLLVCIQSYCAGYAYPPIQWKYSSIPQGCFAGRAGDSSFPLQMSPANTRPNIRLDFSSQTLSLGIVRNGEGQNVLFWTPVPAALFYNIYSSPDPQASEPWNLLGSTSATQYNLPETESKMFYRVRAVMEEQ